MPDTPDTAFKVLFSQMDRLYIIYSYGISEETLVGFIEVDEVVAIEQVISEKVSADTSAYEAILNQYDGVKRSYIPMHTIIRIDEITMQDIPLVQSDAKAKISHIHGGPYKKNEAPKE